MKYYTITLVSWTLNPTVDIESVGDYLLENVLLRLKKVESLFAISLSQSSYYR